MNIQVANKTEKEFEVGGVKIAPFSSSFTRSSLITDEEKEAIQEAGYVIKFTHIFVIEEKEVSEEILKDDSTDDVIEEKEVSDKAYPVELIKKDGTLTKAPNLKAKLEAVAALELPMLDDNDFKAKYPSEDIEKHRVEV